MTNISTESEDLYLSKYICSQIFPPLVSNISQQLLLFFLSFFYVRFICLFFALIQHRKYPTSTTYNRTSYPVLKGPVYLSVSILDSKHRGSTEQGMCRTCHKKTIVWLSEILQAGSQQAINLKSSMREVFIWHKLAHGINQSFFYLPVASFQHFPASLWSGTLFVWLIMVSLVVPVS